LTLETADVIQQHDVDFVDFISTVQFLSVFFCDSVAVIIKHSKEGTAR